MATSPELSLIVPAYNEAARIAETLDAIVSYLERGPNAFEVIVAADGDDATRDEAERRAREDPRVRVTASAARRGKGRAVREAVRLARGRLIGYMDADGKTPVEELEKLLPWLAQDWDVVVGSRALPGSRLESRRRPHRTLGSLVFRALVRGVLGLRDVRDTQCGFKLFRAEAARDLFARQHVDGYLFDLELLLLARASGYRIREVAIRWRDDRDSRFDALAGSAGILRDLLRIARQRVWGGSPPAVGGDAGSSAPSRRRATRA
jgi:dolichyl-phosphate beta-glucosyltransferase